MDAPDNDLDKLIGDSQQLEELRERGERMSTRSRFKERGALQEPLLLLHYSPPSEPERKELAPIKLEELNKFAGSVSSK